VAAGVQHTIQVRFPRGTTGSSLASDVSAVHDLFQALNGALPSDLAFTAAEYALTDEDTFTPCAPPDAVTGALDPADYSPNQKITGTTFSGRSAGSRARVTVFGVFWDVNDPASPAKNGIVTAAEVAAIGTAAAVCSTHFVANSGLAAAFAAQATIKENDHLLKLVRKGTIS